MQHLTPVGLSKDGSTLILLSEAGEEFAVPVDHRFRTALRGDHARPGQWEMKMESALRPRDIQSRIRGGETAEQVAAAAQTTVEAIMPFAAPVLAERAHVAQTALKSSIRRTTSEASPVARTLDEATRLHLSALQVRADDVEWDAWRREDGRWSLIAEFIAGDDLHRAEFTYDPPGRYVLAENDQARLLTGEAVHEQPQAPPERRLSAVPAAAADELPLGDDALELVREPEAGPTSLAADADLSSEEAETATSDLSEVATAVRQQPPARGWMPPSQEPDVAADHADADWIVAATPSTERVDPAQAGPAPAREEPGQDEPATRSEPAEPLDRSEESVTPEVLEPPSEPASPPKKKGRSSVPSWDEIMFGGGKHE